MSTKDNYVNLNEMFRKNEKAIRSKNYTYSDDETNAVYKLVNYYFHSIKNYSSDEIEDEKQELVTYLFDKIFPKVDLTLGSCSTYLFKAIRTFHSNYYRSNQKKFEEGVLSTDSNLNYSTEHEGDFFFTNFVASEEKSPYEKYNSKNSQFCFDFFDRIYAKYPYLQAVFEKTDNITNIASQINTGNGALAQKIKSYTNDIKFELIKQNIHSLADFHEIKTPIELIFSTFTKEITPEVKKFLKEEFRRSKSALYVCSRYQLSVNQLVKAADLNTYNTIKNKNAEYNYLLNNMKERGYKNAKGVLDLALEVMPSKIHNFKKMNEHYFDLLNDKINSNKLFNNLYAKNIAINKIPGSAYTLKEEKINELIKLSKEIKEFELHCGFNDKILNNYIAKPSQINTK